MKFVFILLLCFLLLFLVLLIPAKLKVTASFEKVDFKVSVLGFKLPTKKEGKTNKKKKGLKGFLKGHSLSSKINVVFSILKQILSKTEYVLKRSKVEQFNLDITVAGDDAATAAIEYGAVCAVVYPAFSLIQNYNKNLKENINISCDYTVSKPHLDFCCVVSIRLIHLLAVLSVLPAIIKAVSKKGD